MTPTKSEGNLNLPLGPQKTSKTDGVFRFWLPGAPVAPLGAPWGFPGASLGLQIPFRSPLSPSGSPQNPPRSPHHLAQTPQDRPKTHQDHPKTPQDRPRNPPRPPKIAPRPPQDPPRPPQDRPKTPPIRPRASTGSPPDPPKSIKKRSTVIKNQGFHVFTCKP